MTPAPTEEDLIAFADDRLDEARAAIVAAWLTERPEEEKRINEWRRQNVLLRSVLDPAIDEVVPAELSGALYRPPRRFLPLALAASIAALIALPLGALIGWQSTLPAADNPLTRLAETGIATHVLYVGEVRHPVEVTADDQAHLVSWLSKRTNVAVKTPDLSKQGLKLLGGRLVPGDDTPAAQLMYEGTNGERFTLFLERTMAKGTTAFRYAGEGNTGALYWRDGDCAYVLSGPLERSRLWAVARAVYDQFDD